MLLRNLKKTLVFSVVAVGTFMFLLSCDSPLNPFSTNLGKKVDIEPPTVTVMSPSVGAMLKGSRIFKGTATAYRDLKNVDYRILHPNDSLDSNGNPTRAVLRDWTSINLTGEPKFKQWDFDLDTRNFEDDFLKLQFRSNDGGEWKGRQNESEILKFQIKNLPSTIKTSDPAEEALKAGNAEIITGLELKGSVSDRRGVKHGYPQIKFWPEDLPGGEPADEDPNWGWAVLPMTNYGEDHLDYLNGYHDRNEMTVVNDVFFGFSLNEYTIDPTTRRLIYNTPVQQLPPGKNYHFKIQTRETYFDENATRADGTKNPRYTYPCPPPDGETELEAFYPETGYYTVKLNSLGSRPDIDIDNSDITSSVLSSPPHIYIEDLMAYKILPNGVAAGTDVFRLQIKATHEEPISSATLEWSHVAGGAARTGALNWDNLSGTATTGGKIFTYTAKGSDTTVPPGVPGHINTRTFYSSSQPYNFTVKVPYNSGQSTVEMRLKLYLSGDGPTVKISSVRGYSESPTNADPYYTVNGNIQVAVDITNTREIKKKKWWIETTDPSNSSSMKAKLDAFRTNPITADKTFFDDTNIPNTLPNSPAAATVKRGWISDANVSGTYLEDKALNFKANVKQFWEENSNAKKDIYVYAIAQDEMFNLGYTVQRMLVDEESDKPILEISDLLDESKLAGITAATIENLYVSSEDARKNVISSGTSIEFSFKDDDAIRPVAGSGQPSGVSIMLIAHDYTPKKTATITPVASPTTAIGYIPGFGTEPQQDYNVFLTQEKMKQALGLTTINPSQPTQLPDGLYTVIISITDDPRSKVDIPTNTYPSAAPATVQTIHFAVHSNEGPEITITAPGINSMQNKTPVNVYGTVTSRTRVQKLQIAYTPDIVNNPPTATGTRTLALYRTAADALAANNPINTPLASADGRDANGLYTYYWADRNVNFDPVTLSSLNSEDRNFTVTAWDGLAQPGELEYAVKVDTTPPEVAFVQFNFGRLYHDGTFTVNGKVPIDISVTDGNTVKLPIYWFILPKGTSITGWTSEQWKNTSDYNGTNGTNGRAGTLTAANSVGGGNYRFFINTASGSATSLPDGDYYLYVYAVDDANNEQKPESYLHDFTVRQNTDRPYLRRDNIYPIHNGFIGISHDLVIKGRVFDDDGFDAAKALTRKYVQIRFRNESGAIYTGSWTSGGFTYTAGTGGWIPIDAERVATGAAAGDLEYSFRFDDPGANPQRHPYFGDGIKEYQLRVIDELDAANNDASTKPDPWGKNPDRLTNQVPPPSAATTPNATALTVYYPGADPNADEPAAGENITNWYKFTIKTTPPQIEFKEIPEANRVYRTPEALLTDLQGGKIIDDSLRDANFAFRGKTSTLPLNAYGSTAVGLRPDTATNVKSWTWTLNGFWVGTEDDPDTTSENEKLLWDNAPEGLNSVKVRATDTLQIPGELDWNFTKDTKGPTLSFDNISAELDNGVYGTVKDPTRIKTVSETTVSGQFNDLYSNLGIVQSPLQSAESFEYRIYRKGASAPAWTPQLITNGGAFLEVDPPDPNNKKGATWKVEIPGTYLQDGPYQIEIRVTDILGNMTTTNPIEFIVDRRAPEMLVAVENTRFINSAQTSGASTPLRDIKGAIVADGPLVESDRVFSVETDGVTTDKVFTLSGLVYEHNLKDLRVNFYSGSTTVPALDRSVVLVTSTPGTPPALGTVTRHAVLWANGENTTAVAASADGTFRVRQAKAIDMIGSAAFNIIGGEPTIPDYVYVWELDVRKSDLAALPNPLGEDPDRISRAIAINAYDEANKNAGWTRWLFKLDSKGPEITLGNLQKDLANIVTLEDPTTVLQVSAADAANIQSMQYHIEKYESGGTWVKVGEKWHTNGTGTWTNSTGGFIDYPDWTPAPSVNWRITNNDAIPTSTGDGLYRLSVKVADGSLKTTNSTTSAGNVTTEGPIYFFVDRAGPRITWEAVNSYYRWDTNNKITFTVTAEDVNTINNPPSGGALTNSSGADMGALITYTVAGGSLDSSSVTLTVTVDKNGQTINDGTYTLTLNIVDKAGIKALSNHTTNFNLDTTPPGITLETVVNDNVIGTSEAITGRVIFRGRFNKPSTRSPVSRVAYQVTTAAVPNPTALDDVSLKAAGWYFNNDKNTDPWKLWIQDGGTLGSTPPALTPPGNQTGKGLIEIDQGLSVATLKLYDTRRLVTYRNANTGSTVLGDATTSTGGLTFNGTSLTGETVHQLRIWLLAIDEAGNSTVQSFDRWVYPKGDIPIVTEISSPKEKDEDGKLTPEVDRRLNGSITISGKATDNYRIGRVWFRVLKDNETTGAELTVPEWDANWNARPGTKQAPQSKTDYSGTASSGWYMANGGGLREQAWWAQINTQGELDPTGSLLERPITIQVIAEDMIYDDDTDENTVSYDTNNPEGWKNPSGVTNWFSERKSVRALVVRGAPVFSDERVKSETTGWGSINNTNVKGRASYQVTVSHTSGLGAVRWTNAPAGAGVSTMTNIFDLPGATAGNVNTDGIQVNAAPKDLKSSITLGYWYMIWTPSALLPTGVPNETDNKQYVIFKASGNNSDIGTMRVLESVNETSTDTIFEWLVTVDINTIGPNSLNITQGYYEVRLEAADISTPVAITSRKIASIPIDNVPPTGLYSHSTNIAGTAPTFGGEAADAGLPSGLSRVVMWFSRQVGNDNVSIIWNDPLDSHTKFNDKNPGALTTLPDGVTGTLLAGVKVPNFVYDDSTAANFTTTDNNSYIVIDRQDPLGNQTHHGHKQRMGWATAAGGGKTWYVSLDSTKIESGRVFAHYIVYDTAGNGRYYNQRLMVLNNVPKISKITLATDIGTANPLNALQTAMGGGTGNVNFNNTDAQGGAMQRIRTAMSAAGAAAGISEELTIDTSKEGVYSMVIDQKDFMVRNNLLAVKVETTQALSDSKNRFYRLEYVATTRLLSGFGNTGDTLNAAPTAAARGGIRAGKVYIINNPGTNFPWGVYGAGKLASNDEGYSRGTAFLAMVDCTEVDLGGTGDFGSPSAWELNGSYYNANGTAANTGHLTRTVPTNLQFPQTTPNATVGATRDLFYAAGGTGGLSADFVYRAGAFGTANGTSILDFDANGGANLDPLGRPYGYPASATQEPRVAHSLFIVKVFDGSTTNNAQAAEAELFGDFALLSVRVNNNDVTPPYAQVYDLNPKTEGEVQADALRPGPAGRMGENRAKGGLWDVNSGNEIEKSGHIEPRKTTSLTNTEMGGPRTGGTLTNPAVTTSAYFEVDTVSGDVIVRGYAEDNQRIARVDMEIWSTATTPARLSTTTILTQGEAQGDKTNNAPLKPPTAITARVQFTETIDLYKHRVEWAYLWPSDDIPGGTNVVGDFNVRVRAYNANSGIRATANGTAVTTNDRVHTSTLITHAAMKTAADNNTAFLKQYDSFNVGATTNTGFPASGTISGTVAAPAPGPLLRYNEIRVNLRPYITGFLRNQSEFAHNIRSRQGRYILRRGETPAISGFNLGGAVAATNINIYLPYSSGTGTAITLAAITTEAQRNNYVVNPTHRDLTPPTTTPATGATRVFTTRYRLFSEVIPTTAVTGEGKIELSVNGYSAVNNPRQASSEAANGLYLRPMEADRPVVQPWNKEYNVAIDGTELWDDYIMVHIWRNDADMGTVDRGRFAKGGFSITYPSMSINPDNGTLWASHQEGGRKPVVTNTNLYPGGGAYISNNSSTQPYRNPTDTDFTGYSEGLRQIGAFSEHMTYTNVYVDNNAKVWAIANSITKYGEANRWRYLPGMWLWGPVDNYDRLSRDLIGTGAENQQYYLSNYNGNPAISHFPRGHGIPANASPEFHGGPDGEHGFEFPWDVGNENLTGMYAVESLWYNGATNSRSVSEPQNTEQFHNPHIVTDAKGEYVHVSYYDSKDGSIKYRYNEVGSTGIVSTEESPRNWVNIDGGADVDDNSTATSRPGKGAANRETANYRGNYPAEAAHNPNLGENEENSAYEGGTSYTFTQAASGATGNFTAVRVQNGAYVTTSTPVYTIGGVTYNAQADGFIVLNHRTPTNTTVTGANAAYRIYTVADATTSRIVTNGNGRDLASPHNTGRHNAIAVTSQGYPVVAYYDETSQGLKLAVSNDAAPTLASNWKVFSTSDIFADETNSVYASGTGEYVSVQINPADNTIHIAAMNALRKNVVYIKGTLNVSTNLTSYTLANVTAQVVDSVGNVGTWCKLSLDKDGNPWIAYMDDGYRGSRDGVKVAYYNPGKYYKGTEPKYNGQDIDLYNKSISGWEAMHVPTAFRVENNELGMERFPTIRNTTATRPTGSGGLTNFAAVGFLGQDYYRIAYYIE